MKIRLVTALAMTLGLPAAAARAQAEPPPPPAPFASPASPARPAGAAGEFGDAGQVVIGVDVPFANDAAGLALERSTVGGSTRTVVVIRPSADYFVTPHVSVGGMLGYARGDVAFGDPGASSISSVTTFIAGARAGYDVRMTELVSIWGRIELTYAHSSSQGGAYAVPIAVNVPILLHPATHFFLGAGPTFSRDLIARVGGNDIPKATNYGLQGIIGGYFGD